MIEEGKWKYLVKEKRGEGEERESENTREDVTGCTRDVLRRVSHGREKVE